MSPCQLSTEAGLGLLPKGIGALAWFKGLPHFRFECRLRPISATPREWGIEGRRLEVVLHLRAGIPQALMECGIGLGAIRPLID